MRQLVWDSVVCKIPIMSGDITCTDSYRKPIRTDVDFRNVQWLRWLSLSLKFEICSFGSNSQYFSIGSDSGLAPSRRQAIILTNADTVHRRIYAALAGDELMNVLSVHRKLCKMRWFIKVFVSRLFPHCILLHHITLNAGIILRQNTVYNLASLSPLFAYRPRRWSTNYQLIYLSNSLTLVSTPQLMECWSARFHRRHLNIQTNIWR